MRKKNERKLGVVVEAIMNTHVFSKSDIGCVIDGSSQSADWINQETIEFAEDYGFDAGEIPDENDEDYRQILSETADDAVSFLNDLEGLPYCYWSFEDNSLFYGPYLETLREDVDFVSSRENEYPPEDFQGEWLHVNDHGNATLYLRENGEDKEIWAIV